MAFISSSVLALALSFAATGGGGKGMSMGKLELTDEDRELLDKLVNEGSDNKPENYIT